MLFCNIQHDYTPIYIYWYNINYIIGKGKFLSIKAYCITCICKGLSGRLYGSLLAQCNNIYERTLKCNNARCRDHVKIISQVGLLNIIKRGSITLGVSFNRDITIGYACLSLFYLLSGDMNGAVQFGPLSLLVLQHPSIMYSFNDLVCPCSNYSVTNNTITGNHSFNFSFECSIIYQLLLGWAKSQVEYRKFDKATMVLSISPRNGTPFKESI